MPLFQTSAEKPEVQLLRIFLMIVPALISCKTDDSDRKDPRNPDGIPDKNRVTVAAVQCPSRMGDKEYNRKLLASLIRKAAREGAEIIVTPECSVTGYMDPARGIVWSRKPDGEDDEKDITSAAETVPGPSTRFFCELARSFRIYLCISLAEHEKGSFYNTQVLISPKGSIIGHHRKKNLWPVGDSSWAEKGDLPIVCVDTPYGRIGLMICYDLHLLPAQLETAGADIICYSIGWYGLETRNFFRHVFAERYVKPNSFSVIGANWASEKEGPDWSGTGASFVMSPDGTVKAMARTRRGSEIVLSSLRRRKYE